MNEQDFYTLKESYNSQLNYLKNQISKLQNALLIADSIIARLDTSDEKIRNAIQFYNEEKLDITEY